MPSGAPLLVKKAVITAAARSQRALPLQTLIDGDGNEKSLLRILIEQSLAAGVEEIAVVVWPGDETPMRKAPDLTLRRSGLFLNMNRAATATPSIAPVRLRTATHFCTWWATISTSAPHQSLPLGAW